jgi:hypothetical protein
MATRPSRERTSTRSMDLLSMISGSNSASIPSRGK